MRSLMGASTPWVHAELGHCKTPGVVWRQIEPWLISLLSRSEKQPGSVCLKYNYIYTTYISHKRIIPTKMGIFHSIFYISYKVWHCFCITVLRVHSGNIFPLVQNPKQETFIGSSFLASKKLSTQRASNLGQSAMKLITHRTQACSAQLCVDVVILQRHFNLMSLRLVLQCASCHACLTKRSKVRKVQQEIVAIFYLKYLK